MSIDGSRVLKRQTPLRPAHHACRLKEMEMLAHHVGCPSIRHLLLLPGRRQQLLVGTSPAAARRMKLLSAAATREDEGHQMWGRTAATESVTIVCIVLRSWQIWGRWLVTDFLIGVDREIAVHRRWIHAVFGGQAAVAGEDAGPEDRLRLRWFYASIAAGTARMLSVSARAAGSGRVERHHHFARFRSGDCHCRRRPSDDSYGRHLWWRR
ncbi:hypothetical protein ACLOJK_022948 [Asimina triloba]